MNMVYSKPVTVAEFGTSDHNMVLLKPSSKRTLGTGNMTRMSVNSMVAKEKATFELALSLIKWEPLYRLYSCNGKYVYYQTVIDKLIKICFPSKEVTRHTSDKPWIPDGSLSSSFPFVRGEVLPATFSLPHLIVFSTLFCLLSSFSSLPPLLPSSHLS